MEGLLVLDSGVEDNKAKREKMVKGSFGNTPRKRLADISNFQEKKSKPTTQVEKPPSISPTTKEYIEHLHQENMALTKLLADRNKIIEVTAIELQKLRISLQKLQQQNLQLAQANSQMLAELNSGKDRLKVLHHELGCKNSILKVRNSELEEKAKKRTCKKTGNQVGTTKCEEAGEESLQEGKSDDKPCSMKRWQSKNQSIVNPSTSKQVQEKDKAENKKLQSRRQSTSKQVQEKDKAENKKLQSRRQSARFISVKSEPSEDLFEIDDAKYPASQLRDDPMHDNCPTSLGSSGKKDDGDVALGVETPEFRRSSIGRPLRRAAERVQSYKEIPLNVKMRRSA